MKTIQATLLTIALGLLSIVAMQFIGIEVSHVIETSWLRVLKDYLPVF